MEKGLIHIYCGEGKGKTSAAFGLALRCAGHGERVIIAQFLKDGNSGECEMMRRLPQVQVFGSNPSGKFSFQMNAEEKIYTKKAVQHIFQQAVAAAADARMLVLDEAMAALSCDFLQLEDVLQFLEARPAGLEVVLTGRYPPQELLDRADYVSEIQKMKHPFDRGVAARDGIER